MSQHMSRFADYIEVNFDGLVGPSHNYAGLSMGNLASQLHKAKRSNPRAAALQGLDKMRVLMDLGLTQGFLPPLARPNLRALYHWGFRGSTAQMLAQAYQQAPHLLAAAWSASSMWTANAATITPSCDSVDGKLHVTPANLIAMPHRAIEAPQTAQLLQQVFPSAEHVVHHEPLIGGMAFADEGAANHCRLHNEQQALHLYVYGRDHTPTPSLVFPARQTLLTCQAIARQHGVASTAAVYAQQAVEAINAGAFHNDVVAVSHGGTLLYHEQAFSDEAQLLNQLRHVLGDAFVPVRVNSTDLSLAQAVQTYLFNSQLVTDQTGQQRLIAPIDVQENPQAHTVVENILADRNNPIQHVDYLDVRESMRNGGGPACLRLRVLLNAQERTTVQQNCLLDAEKWQRLANFVSVHYRDRVEFEDLRDAGFAEETLAVTEKLYVTLFGG